MKNAFRFFSIIALAMVIGFAFAACKGGDSLSGIWKSDDGEEIRFNKSSFEISQNNKPGMRGAYSVDTKSASSITITMAVKEVHGDFLNKNEMGMRFESKWYSKNQTIAVIREWLQKEHPSATDSQISEILKSDSSGFDEIYPTETVAVDGDTMIMSDGKKYTRDARNGGR
jgi:hypothetical protein